LAQQDLSVEAAAEVNHGHQDEKQYGQHQSHLNRHGATIAVEMVKGSVA